MKQSLQDEGFAAQQFVQYSQPKQEFEPQQIWHSPISHLYPRAIRELPADLFVIPDHLPTRTVTGDINERMFWEQKLQVWLQTRRASIIYRRFKAQFQYNKVELSSKKSSLRKSRKCLGFDSCFENGNLGVVMQGRKEDEFDLVMQTDTNSTGYTQWFFFAVSGLKKKKYQFNLINYRKRYPNFKSCIKPLVYSSTLQKWYYLHSPLLFYPNALTHNSRPLHSLSFLFQPQTHHQQLYFCSHLPYPFSRSLHLLTLQPQRQVYFLCKTLAGNSLSYIRMGHKDRPIVIIQARQHPGESCSSFVVESIIQELNSESLIAKEALKKYQFVIIPMVNIDGVIHGNFRCDVTGLDLNRVWDEPCEVTHPTVTALYRLYSSLSPKIKYFIDLHGHSKQPDCFAYCSSQSIKTKLLTLLMDRHELTFSFPNCTFGISKDKLSTARAVMYHHLRTQSLTLEVSLFNASQTGSWHPAHFKRIGLNLLRTLAMQTNQVVIKQMKEKVNSLVTRQDTEGSDSQAEQYLNPKLKDKKGKHKQNAFKGPKFKPNLSKRFKTEISNNISQQKEKSPERQPVFKQFLHRRSMITNLKKPSNQEDKGQRVRPRAVSEYDHSKKIQLQIQAELISKKHHKISGRVSNINYNYAIKKSQHKKNDLVTAADLLKSISRLKTHFIEEEGQGNKKRMEGLRERLSLICQGWKGHNQRLFNK